MPVLDHPTATVDIGLSTPAAIYSYGSRRPAESHLMGGVTYPITVDILVPGDASDVPESARIAVWLSDFYQQSWGDETEREAYRCELGKLEAGRSQIIETTATHVKIRATGNFEIRSQCVGRMGAAQVERSIRANWGWSAQEIEDAAFVGWGGFFVDPHDPGDSTLIWKYNGTRVSASYDVEGVTSVVLDDATTETACAPNPPGFFYDADAQVYDMLAYYGQRRIASDTDVNTATGYRRSVYRYIYPENDLTWVGPSEFSVGSNTMDMSPSLEVTNQPTLSPSLPVTVGWWGAHHTSPVRHDGNPVSFKAHVFIWPSDRAGERLTDPPELGVIELATTPTWRRLPSPASTKRSAKPATRTC